MDWFTDLFINEAKAALDSKATPSNKEYTEKDPTVPAWAKEPSKPSYTKAEVGLNNVEDVRQYSPSNPPPYPVTSVNGKTGSVSLDAATVGARPSTWMPTAQEVGALPNTYTPPNQTAEQVGADSKGTAASAVSQHNTADDSHNDIRLELKTINDRLTAFFDSDNQTLDELSEIVAYITSNKSLIDSITTSKVSVADIINNLTTNVSNKPLSAAQGVALKSLIDGLDTALDGKLATSELTNAINAALAQAKASGEFDGADGKTPVKGVDYFIPADQEAIVQQVIAALGTPVFGRVESSNKIVLTGNVAAGTYEYWYEDENGKQSYMCTFEHDGEEEPVYINALSLAIDSDGTPYNGGKGYKTGYRLNSSAVEAAKDGMEVTGFIPVSANDVLYLYGIDMKTDSANKANTYIYAYGSNFANIGSCYFRMDSSAANAIANGGIVVDATNNVVQIHLNNNLYANWDIDENPIAYLRFCADEITDASIVTINEPISGSGSGGPSYTNQLPISTDTDGSVYNNTGYKTASRISSSGDVSTLSNPSASNPAFVTGFIPCVKGDIIRLSNCFIDTDGTGSDSSYYGQDIGGLRVAVYNSSKSFLSAAAWNEYASGGLLADYTVGDNGYITRFSINNANCAFVRLCLGGDPETAIITINQEITDDSGMGDSGEVELTWTQAKIDKTTGVDGEGSGGYYASQHIDFVDGYAYTASQTNVYGGITICYYGASGNYLGYEELWSAANGENTKAIERMDGATTFRVRLYNGSGSSLDEECYHVTFEKTA